MRYRVLPLIVMLAVTPTATFAQASIPSFVAELITQYKSAPAGSSPGSVWRYQYKGAVVFFVPRLSCCDIPSRLYDVNGNLLCRPDGGIAGSGDGKCPDFFRERSKGELLWSDGTAGESQ
jgi:hypothetical protein